MGLVPTVEHAWAADSIAAAARIMTEHIDLDALVRIARAAPPVGPVCADTGDPAAASSEPTGRPSIGVRIGILRDSAFQFYYPENIEALKAAGAEIVYVSPLTDDTLPPALDALYIGGGFPETHGPELAANTRFSGELRRRVEGGFPVYAECGGLMYLGEELVVEGQRFPMSGVLPISFGLSKRPQGHGYTVVSVERDNPYFPTGSQIRGHEFHYSRVLRFSGGAGDLVFRVQRGAGIHAGRDGIVYKNVLATYTHIHALGTPGWAGALVRNALEHRSRNPRR